MYSGGRIWKNCYCSKKLNSCNLKYFKKYHFSWTVLIFGQEVSQITAGAVVCQTICWSFPVSKDIYFRYMFKIFLILCTWENSSFAKEEGLHHKCLKQNLVWRGSKSFFWILNFLTFVCLFLYLFVFTSTFANFARRSGPIMIQKTVFEIRIVMWY